jgi:hypothetical protein
MVINKTPVHPFLFAAFPVLTLFTHNSSYLSFSQLWLPLALSQIAAAVFYGTAVLFCRNSKRAALIASFFILIFFSYDYLFGAFWHTTLGPFAFNKHHNMFLAIIVCCGLLVYGTLRLGPGALSFLTRLCTVVAGMLVLMNAGLYAWFALETRPLKSDAVFSSLSPADTAARTSSRELPDIYYIILDRYAGQQSLRAAYNFDNSAFLNFLKERKFFIADSSHSNYLKTAYSLASSLNMDYLDGLERDYGPDNRSWRPLYKLLEDFRVQKILKQYGYRFILCGSWWDPTRANTHADMTVNRYAMPEFLQIIYRTSILYPLGRNFNAGNLYYQQWKRAKYKLDQMAHVPDIQGPTFTFAHFLIPHRPYVFSRTGQFTPVDDAQYMGSPQQYCDQLAFVNTAIERLVDTLLHRSKLQPVIIIQSDEGLFPERYEANEDAFDWQKATDSELYEKTDILNALYLPGLDTGTLYAAMTPVNTFRIIFNTYLGMHLPLLQDRIYAYTSSCRLYDFFPVTDRVRTFKAGTIQ